jgi:NADPH2:quinone reductase
MRNSKNGRNTMKAAIYQKTGAAAEVFQIVDLDKPVPAEGEVLVRIHASGINPTDTKTRAGMFPIQHDWKRIVPHHDGAGVIEAVGEGVTDSRVGERVWLHSTEWGGADGTAAEYAVAKSINAVVLPDNVSFEAGATFGVPLLTAYRAVTLDGSVAGKSLLIQGGAGAVGNYAIQIARQLGAIVIATVSSEDKSGAAKAAGADHVINYKAEDLLQRVQQITNGTGVDHIIEVNLSANANLLPGLIKNGGFVTVYGTDDFMTEFPAVGAVIQQMRFGFFIVFMLPPDVLAVAVADLTEMLQAGQITAPIHARFPLDQIAKAHDVVDAKTTLGNVVITLD